MGMKPVSMKKALDQAFRELDAAKARIAELESFQPAQVLDVLDANQKLETDLRAQVDYATRLEKENEYLDDRYFKLQNRNIRDCHERDRYREALEKIAFKTREYAPTLQSCQSIATIALKG